MPKITKLPRKLKIQWNRWYSFISYISSSLWLVPFIAILAEQVTVRVIDKLEHWMLSKGYINQQTSFYSLNTAEAQTVLNAIFTLNMSFLVFTFGSLLVAIQVAGGQYTPRIIATTLLRDNSIRGMVGYFVFTMLFALGMSTRMDVTVQQLGLGIAGILGLFSIVLFLYLIDYAARMLRPISIVARVGEDGIQVINTVYPLKTTRPVSKHDYVMPEAGRTLDHAGKSGIVLAVNQVMLVAEARRVQGVIEFLPQVGDFVAVGEPLFQLYGDAEALDDDMLRSTVALGSERTLEQDPAFAFRILVDIAIKALSAAINDPTTAVLAIDQLHRLLRMVGMRQLQGEEILDQSGHLRLIFRTPNWEDFVHLAFHEIRQCGAGSIQIPRRLRSMMENLLKDLPEHRHRALREELDRLDRTLKDRYTLPEDLALARIPDAQGLGSSQREPPRARRQRRKSSSNS